MHFPYAATSIARGREGAVKITVAFKEEPEPLDLKDVEANAASAYRAAYGTDPSGTSNAQVQLIQPKIPEPVRAA
jgi:hypothetical protein